MRSFFQIFLFSLLSFCSTNVLQGQQPVMRQFTTEDGLPGGMVYITIQDKQGYIWIGTDRGIVRFDGNEFKIFTVKDGLPSNEVWGISEDKSGKLWIDTFNGICYIKDGQVHNLNEGPPLLNQPGRIAHLLTSVGHYILLDNNKLFYLPEGGIPINVTDKTVGNNYLASDFIITEELLHDSIRQKIRQTHQLKPTQNIIFIKETMFIDTDNSFTTKLKELQIAFAKNKINRLHIDVEPISENEALILISGQIWRLNSNGFAPVNTEHLFEKEENNITVNWIKKLASNLIWLKTNKGNFIVDSLLSLNTDYDFLYDIPTNNIFLDRQNNLWLSSFNGLYFISQNVQSSRSFSNNSTSQSNSFNFLSINDQNNIWSLNADGYLYYLDFEKGLRPFLDRPIMSAPSDLSFDFDNNLWISGSLLSKIAAKDLQDENLNSNNYQLQTISSSCSRAVKNIHFLDQERYLIASFNCFAEYHQQATVISRLNGRHYGIAVVDDNHFVVSGKYGTRKVFRKEGILVADTIPSDEDHSILHLPTNNIAIGADKIPWLAVNNIGVYHWNKSRLDSIIELTNVLVQSLYVDKKQQLWASTNKGIAKIHNITSNPFSYDFQWFKTKNGLISNDVKAVLIQDNKIIAATNNGITILSEKQNNNLNTNAPFRFTALQVNGQNQKLRTNYDLSYKENNLLIKYECLDFKNMGSKTFQHKLEGVDESWVDNANFEKEYAALSPGNYTFLLRRKPNTNAEATSEELSLFFSIKPPFWETAWFLAIVLLLLCSFAYILYRNQIQKIEAQAKATNELNKKFAELELNALQSQMNPHFVFNALNAIQDFIFKNDARDANRYLVKFSRLMRLILESSKEKTILLEDEIQLLQLYIDLEELRFEDKFTYDIQIGDNFSPALISIPSMLLQPFVENAINHGLIKLSKPGKLLLSFNRKGQTLHCRIEDNGIGINKSQEDKKNYVTGHKSRGMQLVKERQRVWNIIGDTSVTIDIKDLFDQQMKTTGTQVNIYITLEQFENDPKN